MKSGRFFGKIMFFAIGISILIFSNAYAGQWQQDVNGWWYQNDDGSYFSNTWIHDEKGDWYYLDNNGYMQTGWLQLDGNWYYLNVNGSMVTGWNEIDGKKYYFNADGSMATNAFIDGYQIKTDGTIAETILHNEDELNEYLYNNYRIIHTNLGDIEVGFKRVSEMVDFVSYSGNYASANESIWEPYDYRIYTMWSKELSTQYYKIMDSIGYTEQEKKDFIKCLEDYQYNMAQDIISKMPGKKIQGGYYVDRYKYENIKVGRYIVTRDSWCNFTYNQNSDSAYPYYNNTISDFQWLSY